MKQIQLHRGAGVPAMVAGLWLVLLALCFRLVLLWPFGTPLPAVSRAAAIAGQCLGVDPVREETASERIEEPEKPPKLLPQEERMSAAVPAFTGGEAQDIAIGGALAEEIDKTSLLLTPLAMEPEAQVLIVHTHTSEAYTPEPGWEYEASADYRTLDPARSVVRVGEELAMALRRQGIGVIHDTTVCDDPDYDRAYERSYDVIEAQLAAHPSIRIVLDIHRDAMIDAEGNAAATTWDQDGSCARLMLVVGTDEGGLYHPNWRENLSFALKLQALLNRSAPGLCRDLSLRRERFNQHFTPCSVLVEVGAAGNTLAQALPAVRYLADAVAELIQAASG